jgi:hypothetical protein
VPAGWPDHLTGALSWTGDQFESNAEAYTEELNADDTLELKAAVEAFQRLSLDRGSVCPETFAISERLVKRLRNVTDIVYQGRGFHVLRGLDLSQFTDCQSVILYAGLTSYVGNRRASNIDHIRDRTHSNPRKEELKPLEQSMSMGFHSDIDVGDIVSMFVQTVPLEGGHQYLASINSIYNLLVKSDPDVLNVLSDKWYWERTYRPEPDQRKRVSFERPLIAFATPENHQLQVNYAATFIGGDPAYPLSASAPPLTPRQQHALTTLQSAAKQTCVRLIPQPGDILFVNNYAIMHARDSFVDSLTNDEAKRHIMRLWLHDDEKGWKSAPALERRADRYGAQPVKQSLMTGAEWDELPRGWRIHQMGVSAKDDHA